MVDQFIKYLGPAISQMSQADIAQLITWLQSKLEAPRVEDNPTLTITKPEEGQVLGSRLGVGIVRINESRNSNAATKMDIPNEPPLHFHGGFELVLPDDTVIQVPHHQVVPGTNIPWVIALLNGMEIVTPNAQFKTWPELTREIAALQTVLRPEEMQGPLYALLRAAGFVNTGGGKGGKCHHYRRRKAGGALEVFTLGHTYAALLRVEQGATVKAQLHTV